MKIVETGEMMGRFRVFLEDTGEREVAPHLAAPLPFLTEQYGFTTTVTTVVSWRRRYDLSDVDEGTTTAATLLSWFMTVKKRRKKNRIWTALVDSGTKNCDGPKPISIVGSTTSIGTKVNLKDPNAHTIISMIEATQKICRDFGTLDKRITALENLQNGKAEASIRKLEMKLEKKKLESMDKIMNKLRIAQMKAKEMRIRMSTNEGPRTSLKVILESGELQFMFLFSIIASHYIVLVDGRDCASLCNFGNMNAILGTW
ncbi:hypothetical protein L1987_65548 [Smallanthus sonchifolius]|uniref:Uncharacterized protein n=1 Tax=Smallanthus sonchifolius TaxID=185202 RepID=A0ACB9BUS2_9ASTR|nr:hypothetical protein L1987_65548 [Smallanthus sonchifolius]